jgi:photosystem II stability/assembly factor-like uncharacterized protein
VLVSTDSGVDWSDVTLPPGTGTITDISCPSSSTCYATEDRGVLFTSDFGHTWRTETFPGVPGGLSDISCLSMTTCDAAGAGEFASDFVTTDSGTTWRRGVFPIGTADIAGADLTTIACPSTARCYAIDDNGEFLMSTDSGFTWQNVDSLLSVPGGGYGLALSCPSVSMCVTVGMSGVLVTTDSGQVWTPGNSQANVWSYSGVDCASTKVCFAVGSTGTNDTDGGGVIEVSVDAGDTWTTSTNVPWYGGLSAISCPTAETCYAANNNTVSNGSLPGYILVTTDSGRSWNSDALPQSIGALTDIACPSTTNCYGLEDDVDPTAALGQADFFSTDNGGVTWTSRTLEVGFTEPDGLACPSRLRCYFVTTGAGKSVIFVTLDGGQSWQVHSIGPATENVGSISCPSSTVCYAVGNVVVATTDAGMTWHRQATPISNLRLADITCPSTSACYAVGYNDIIDTADSGTTWNVQKAPSNSDPLEGVACASTSTCVIVGNVLECQLGENSPCPPQTYTTLSTTDSGRLWIGHGLPADVSPTGVACTDLFVCYATIYIGDPSNYGDSGGGGVGGVLKTSSLGETWVAQTVPTATGAVSAVACVSQTICYAVGQGTGAIGGLILRAVDQR